MKKPKHIGIVACSSEGAALCYRTICLEGEKYLGKYEHPEITMHTHSFGEYVRCIKSGDWNCVAKLMISSSKKVAKAGADFIIYPDNTIHKVFDKVVKESPIPWLHIAEEVALEASRNNYKRVGILGTIYLMESEIYPEKLKKHNIDFELPEKSERLEINRIIFDELVKGEIKESSRNYFVRIIEKLKKKGCDAVVLGCTEIPLIVTPKVSPLPTLDSTRILARAALRKALE